MPYPALFLDRDGVVNVDHGYAVTHHRFAFMDGIFDLTRLAVDRGYRVVIVTNQAGIAHGDFTEAEFLRFTDWMVGEFHRHGGDIAGVFHSPFHNDGVLPAYARDSFWRKPAPGMILEAARRLDLDLSKSILVGDQATDMQAAARAGIGRRVLLGHRPEQAADHVVDHLRDVTPFLTGWSGHHHPGSWR
ncbi:D-glycero-D-manno-heptose 1,7-bisphosphate phosphatase [Azospirillum sp. B510]|uniref:D-glycero-alpha-D-manno-heptose-1,7-bisphosphate 7-phosphatase n=1 Tax=Azospirillum sp. (strain B510) TaxID=137722 RepID=UPI0001C4C483|nr:HAD family hydrolase [Azospirillum sp. B510]BAI72079.1 D-glycero-D-manno-heptose 1,7-bisphosphate phosphatase [Azospirillum sp. B510]